MFYKDKMPQHVQFDLTTFFEFPELPSMARIGVITAMKCEDDILCVRGGVSDGGLHDTLAAKVGPTKSKFMQLPSEMYSETGTVSGWNAPEVRDGFGLVIGQIDGTERLESTFGRQETDRCLEMAALALGILLTESPEKLERFNNPHELVVGSKLLAQARRKIGNRIFG